MKVVDRLTEYVDERHFRVVGSKVIRCRKPRITQVIDTALAKLFELEKVVNAPFAYCPYCGSKRGVKSHG